MTLNLTPTPSRRLAALRFLLVAFCVVLPRVARARAQEISGARHLTSGYAAVLGSQIHYFEQGQGPVVLMLHGNPTWSFLWRDVIPEVSANARVIAVDLIGMGLSDKPDIEYRFADHTRYVEGFIEAMDLRDVVLVGHDWGSALALDYAANHESNVRGIVLMEAIIPPTFPLPASTLDGDGVASFFRNLRTPGVGEVMVLDSNAFVEQALPIGVIRPLSDAEMNAYRLPFPTRESRIPTLMWPRELPIGGEPADVTARLRAYAQWMTGTQKPFLYFDARPGLLNSPATAPWLRAHVANVDVVTLPSGIHYLQEDHPAEIGEAIRQWITSLDVKRASAQPSGNP